MIPRVEPEGMLSRKPVSTPDQVRGRLFRGHALATARLPGSATLSAMLPSRSIDQVETDLLALRAAAERAGTALACLFSTSDEFEAAVIKARRDAGAFGPRRKRRSKRFVVLTAILAAAFLML
jgi:hypothetical protein